MRAGRRHDSMVMNSAKTPVKKWGLDTRRAQWSSKVGDGDKPVFWRRLLARLTCKSGTDFVWYQILASIRAALYSKPVSGMHVTKMVICECDWSLVIVCIFVCCWARPGPSSKLVKHIPGVSDKYLSYNTLLLASSHLRIQWRSQGGMGACPPLVAGNFFKVGPYNRTLNSTRFVTIYMALFSRIFNMCLRLLGASPQTPTGALPLDPAGGLPSPNSLFAP